MTDIDAYGAEIREAEDAGLRCDLPLSPMNAVVIIGVLQLALRHPQLPDHTRRVVTIAKDYLARAFDEYPRENRS